MRKRALFLMPFFLPEPMTAARQMPRWKLFAGLFLEKAAFPFLNKFHKKEIKHSMNSDHHLNPTHLSPSRLAYLGDAVWELCVREMLVGQNAREPSREALRYVTAGAQAAAVLRIGPCLTEEEEAVWRRGRNMGHSNIPKSATLGEYCAATGLECLFGWLYLSGKRERIRELFSAAFPPDGREELPSSPDA